MELVVNGKRESLNQPMNILQYLAAKGLEPTRVVVEYNQAVVKKEEWENIILKDEDHLEVLRFVGGG